MHPMLSDLRAKVPWLQHIEWHEQLGSTQDRARELVESNSAPVPFLVGADSQTGGRGRGKHRWWTGQGALAMSLVIDPTLFTPHQAATLPPQLALAVGVAVCHAVRGLLPADNIGLHWPNDIYVGQRKLAGILTEALTPRRVIVGIGLNSNNTLQEAPAELRATAVTLRDLLQVPVDAQALLVSLLSELHAALSLLYEQPQVLGQEFNALCLQRGQMLLLRQGASHQAGRCRGIAPDGGLLLETEAGLQTFYSGTLSSEDL
jgi:BirA family transcriptional regulator, biotin operon repressor / biotin---[acetyl-CoA-carboxylase] ligase